jgi:hypothetical protein
MRGLHRNARVAEALHGLYPPLAMLEGAVRSPPRHALEPLKVAWKAARARWPICGDAALRARGKAPALTRDDNPLGCATSGVLVVLDARAGCTICASRCTTRSQGGACARETRGNCPERARSYPTSSAERLDPSRLSSDTSTLSRGMDRATAVSMSSLRPTLCALSLLLGALVSGCSGGAIDSSNPDDVGELGLGLTSCSNLDGTNSIMAATAVAVAKELHRWQPRQDLYIANGSFGSYLALTSTGKARCAGGVCWNTQALLDMQLPAAAGKVKLPGGITLNPDALRSRFVAKFGEQVTCESQPDNHDSSNCPAEQHALSFVSSAAGACDTVSKFKATTPTGGALRYPAQLKNKLLWVDRQNPYVAFSSVGDQVSIDPTYGLTEGDVSSTGSCTAACTKITNGNATGQCCSCAGVSRKYARSAWSSTTYLCQ